MARQTRQSAGILMYQINQGLLQVLLVHPGGPFWKNKDEGAWTIPKGEFDETEEPLEAAKREFEEELGQKVEGDFKILEPVVQKGGKKVFAWIIEGSLDVAIFKSNSFKMEWPPKSGKWQSFPEVDKAEWMDIRTALEKINPAQASFLKELSAITKTN